MDGFLTAANVVYPLLILLLIGVVIRRIGMVTETGLKEMNRLVCNIFLPALMFVNALESDFSQGIDWRFLVWPLLLLVSIYSLLLLIVPKLEKQRNRCGVLVQGISRSNFLVFGYAIVTSLYGSGRMSQIILLAAIAIPLMNGLSVIALEIFSPEEPDILGVIRNVLKNPIIIATVIAFLCKSIGIRPIPGVFNTLSNVTTPLALIAIGASFTFGNLNAFRTELVWAVSLRLLLIPAVVLPIFIVIGFRNELLVALMTIFGGPTAVSSFAMAQEKGGDGDLAASMVVFSSTLSIVSFFIWISLLRTAMLI